MTTYLMNGLCYMDIVVYLVHIYIINLSMWCNHMRIYTLFNIQNSNDLYYCIYYDLSSPSTHLPIYNKLDRDNV